MSLSKGYFFKVAVVAMSCGAWGQAPPPAPGPYLPLAATQVADLTSYGPGDRLVAAYYFYWYKWKDACIGERCDPTYARDHIEFATGVHNPAGTTDALTDHPLLLESVDYGDPKWHRSEIEAMSRAGIDLILPVFWGVPGRYGQDGHHAARWSLAGLEALVVALDELREEGRACPKVGMFYDTSTLDLESPFHYSAGDRSLDLTTSAGQSHFFLTIRDFYSVVPPRYWAMWENRPLVWLYSSSFAARHDRSIFEATKQRFAAEAQGIEPLFVGNVDWDLGPDEWVYRWGGAIDPSFLSVSAIGPGFDNSGALGKPRGAHVLRDRAEGAFYRNAWERALRANTSLVVIETWNELHEGTGICPTLEYGDSYVDVTKEYASRLKGKAPIPPLQGPFSDADSVSWAPGLPFSQGLELISHEDGIYREVVAGTEVALEPLSSYVYFAVDDSFRFSATGEWVIEAEVLDLPERIGTVRAEYDSWDRDGTHHGIYRSTEAAPLSGTFRWRLVRLSAPQARFANNQNGSADFRLVVPRGLRVRSVRLALAGGGDK